MYLAWRGVKWTGWTISQGRPLPHTAPVRSERNLCYVYCLDIELTLFGIFFILWKIKKLTFLGISLFILWKKSKRPQEFEFRLPKIIFCEVIYSYNGIQGGHKSRSSWRHSGSSALRVRLRLGLWRVTTHPNHQCHSKLPWSGWNCRHEDNLRPQDKIRLKGGAVNTSANRHFSSVSSWEMHTSKLPVASRHFIAHRANQT